MAPSENVRLRTMFGWTGKRLVVDVTQVVSSPVSRSTRFARTQYLAPRSPGLLGLPVGRFPLRSTSNRRVRCPTRLVRPLAQV